MVTTTRHPVTDRAPGSAEYRAVPGVWDEAFTDAGRPRDLYADLLSELSATDLTEARDAVSASAAAQGATFGPGKPFVLDPVPRLIDAAEWAQVETGLSQRLRALNLFCADAYGEQRIFEAGVVPRSLLSHRFGFEPRMQGLLPPDGPAITVAGFDLVRDETGALAVLEDNLRMPSGAAYSLAARRAVSSLYASPPSDDPHEAFFEALAAAIRSAPAGTESDGTAAILSDGPAAGTWFELEALSRILGIPIVTPDELETKRGELSARIDGRAVRLDVIYRRLDDERLSDATGCDTPLGELIVPALRSGRLRCVNAFGTAVADDKLTHAYVEQTIAFYLGEAPILRSVPTYDLSADAAAAATLGRMDELVVKSRGGFGGQEVVIMPRADAATRKAVRAALRQDPGGFIAQEVLALSTHPTVCNGRLAPRHVDLRPFAVAGPADEITVMRGGLTRFAPDEGELIVNSSRGGGGKDTWVVGA